MIAVREEVEVLKERISELMDKINKLELENNILKSNIPQETLQQLQMQLQIAGSQQPAAVAAPRPRQPSRHPRRLSPQLPQVRQWQRQLAPCPLWWAALER